MSGGYRSYSGSSGLVTDRNPPIGFSERDRDYAGRMPRFTRALWRLPSFLLRETVLVRGSTER